MRLTNHRHLLGAAMLILTLGLLAPNATAQSASSPQPQTATGFTRPCKKSKLAFAGVGVVSKILVKEGDIVKEGDLLANQLDSVEQKELELLKMQAASTAKIKANEFDLQVKKSAADRKEKQVANKSASIQELEEAQGAMNVAEQNLQGAKEEKDQAGKKAEEQQAKLDEMQLRAPFNGQVLKITANLGEASGPQSQDGAITLLDNSTLWIDVPEVATPVVAQLKMGEVLDVKYAQDTQWQQAKIIYFSPEADPGGQTRTFRLEMKNPNNVPSGQQIIVKLPDNLAQAQAPQQAQQASAQAGK